MTQEEFWTNIGPFFLLFAGLFMIYASVKYTKEYHDNIDWENENWAGLTSQMILKDSPHWLLKVIFAIVGVFLIGLCFYLLIIWN